MAQKVGYQPRKKLKVWIIISSSIALLILISLGAWTLLHTSETPTPQQASMKEYLDKKYSENFVVQKPALNGSGLGIEGVWQATAYPQGKQNLAFTVTTSSKGTDDQYQDATWREEELARLAPIISSKFQHVNHVNLAIYAPVGSDSRVNGKIPSFQEALSSVGNKIQYDLTIYISPGFVRNHEQEVSKEIINMKNDLPLDKTTAIVDVFEREHASQYGIDLTGPQLVAATEPISLMKYFKSWEATK